MAVAYSRRPAQSNAQPSGVPNQGTLGGTARSSGRRPGSRNLNLGDEVYLWLLVIIEVAAMGWLRNRFRKRHGG